MTAIIIDHETGRVDGAKPVERLGILAFAIAAHLTAYLKRPGYSYLCRFIRTLLPSGRLMEVHFSDGSRFAFPYGDAYWSVFCARQAPYEKEIAALLATLKSERATFIDCGANFGYWSVMASGPGLGAHKAIAIEAAADSSERIAHNRALNGDRFTQLHRAVSDVGGQTVTLHGGAKHEQRSIDPGQGVGGALERVETIAIDDLLPEALDGPIVIKLDVEGVEVQAIAGATEMLKRDTIVAYEEHGKDRAHSVSRALKDDLGMRLFAWSEGERFKEIVDLQTLDALKPNRRVGYDFFATASDRWAERLLA